MAALLVAPVGCGPAPGGGESKDRWVTTEDTRVELDWDAVAAAYREAEGPEDFEQRVNEIYAGDEVISVAVQDVDAKTQQVTGFFDRDDDGKVSDAEKVFSIQRDVVDAESAKVQMHGHGPYAGYHSPVWDIASGMMLGYFVSRAFSPSYVPMYTQPYVTSPTRRQALVAHRDDFRAKNPERFSRASKSGRTYGGKGGAFGGGGAAPAPRGRTGGGGRFGAVREAGRTVVRMSA
jgi:hypothetical protein